VDCGTYIENYLSAYVDGELGRDELGAAERHLATCEACRARVAEERALKTAIRSSARLLKTPARLRENIRGALASAAAGENGAAAVEAREPGRTPGPPARHLTVDLSASAAARRRARLWSALAVAAVLAAIFIAMRGRIARGPAVADVPTFDIAVQSFAAFQAHFEPNVPGTSAPDLSDSYLSHQMPGYIWNFSRSGFELVGGRLDRLPDGRPIAHTLYRGGGAAILCTYVEAKGVSAPPGAIHEAGGHSFYRYKGYTVCFTKYPQDDFVCILVSREPPERFIRAITGSMP
jgi:Putative zinc-finger